MKINEIISEAEVRPYGFKAIPVEETMEFLQKNCSDAMGCFSSPLWRGMSNHSDDVVFIKPGSGERSSQNASNFYTKVLDSSPYFAGWPKRSRSLICTTSATTASMFSNKQYAIFPVNGSKIAVSDVSDIWDVNVNIPEFDMEGIDLLDVNSLSRKLGIQFSDSNWVSAVPTNPRVIKFCQECNQKPENFIPILHKALQPTNIGCKLMTVPEFADFVIGRSNFECWLSDNCVAVSRQVWKQLL